MDDKRQEQRAAFKTSHSPRVRVNGSGFLHQKTPPGGTAYDIYRAIYLDGENVGREDKRLEMRTGGAEKSDEHRCSEETLRYYGHARFV